MLLFGRGQFFVDLKCFYCAIFLCSSVFCSIAVDIQSSIEEEFFIYVNVIGVLLVCFQFSRTKEVFKKMLRCDFDLIAFCTYLCDIIVRVMSFTMLCLVLQKMFHVYILYVT